MLIGAALAAAAAAAILIGLLAMTPVVDRYRQRILRRCLRDVATVLNAHGVDYWLDFGTLLGFHREHDVIRADYDVDVSMLESGKPALLACADALEARGYAVADSNGTTKMVVRISDRRSVYHVDVYTYRPDGAVLRSPYRREDDVPPDLVGDRVEAPFLGTTVRVPRDTARLLSYRYGPTFMTPRRGDQGPAYGYRRWESFVRLLENNGVALWSVARGLTAGTDFGVVDRGQSTVESPESEVGSRRRES
jgi:hypothetical protein